MTKLILDESQPTIIEVQVACGVLHFVIGYDTNTRLRFFLYVSHRSGGCSANLVGIASLLTLWYSDGRLNRQKLIDELFEIDCLNCAKWKGKLLAEHNSLPEYWNRSCCSAVAKILKTLEFKEKK